MEDYRENIVLRPHWMQYVLCKLPDILLCLMLFVICMVVENRTAKITACVFSLILLVYLTYTIADMYRIRYIITPEQIFYKHGVVSYVTDYIELYRVYDYQQTQSPLQQMLGLKNIIIMSSDRSNPQLIIMGQKKACDAVTVIRLRVEYNKLKKNVYEIGNRVY